MSALQSLFGAVGVKRAADKFKKRGAARRKSLQDQLDLDELRARTTLLDEDDASNDDDDDDAASYASEPMYEDDDEVVTDLYRRPSGNRRSFPREDDIPTPPKVGQRDRVAPAGNRAAWIS